MADSIEARPQMCQTIPKRIGYLFFVRWDDIQGEGKSYQKKKIWRSQTLHLHEGTRRNLLNNSVLCFSSSYSLSSNLFFSSCSLLNIFHHLPYLMASREYSSSFAFASAISFAVDAISLPTASIWFCKSFDMVISGIISSNNSLTALRAF